MHHFASRGLYNGLFLMGDRESGSYWDHITGQCVHGPLKGYQLEISSLLHMNVALALESYRNAEIAISKPPFYGKVFGRISEWTRKSRKGFVPPGFRGTMTHADERLPFMSMGLGVWTNHTRRFYPNEVIKTKERFLIDEVDKRRILIFIDPTTATPMAFYTEAKSASWKDQELYLDTHEIVRGGLCYTSERVAIPIERPMQLFTRWYGFSYTFPACEIYGKGA